MIGIFFAYEFVETCLHLPKDGVERPLGAIVRMQMKCGGRRRGVLRCEEAKVGDSKRPQVRGNQTCPSPLTETDQKVAPAEINELTRLSCPAQIDVSRRVTGGTETNIRVWTGQGWIREAVVG